MYQVCYSTVSVTWICFCHRQAISEAKKRASCETKSHKRLDNFLTKIFGKSEA